MVIPRADTASALKQASDLIEQAGNILSNPESSAEERAKVPQMIEDAKKIKADVAEHRALVTALETAKADILQLNGAHSPAASNGQTDAVDFNPEERDLKLRPDGSQYKTIQGYIRALLRASSRVKPTLSEYLKWHDDINEGGATERRDMAEGVGATGGFLVPPEFQATLLSVIESRSVIRPRATIIRMRRREQLIPVLDQTGTTAGVAHWFGGIQAYWTEEAGIKTASDAAFRQMRLIAHKLIGFTRVSDELLEDSVVSLTDFLMGPMGFPGVIAFEEDYSFIQGDGAGKPLGILNSACAITYNREDQDNITYNDLTKMLERFLPSGQGLWLSSINNLSALLQMTGPAGNPSYVWGPGPVGQTAVGRVHGTLLGYPIIFDEKVPRRTTTSVGDLMLIDPSYYVIGDRQATTMASTIYEKFQYDQTSFRATHRVDGQPWLSAPLTLQDGTTQISPFVLLGAKST